MLHMNWVNADPAYSRLCEFPFMPVCWEWQTSSIPYAKSIPRIWKRRYADFLLYLPSNWTFVSNSIYRSRSAQKFCTQTIFWNFLSTSELESKKKNNLRISDKNIRILFSLWLLLCISRKLYSIINSNGRKWRLSPANINRPSNYSETKRDLNWLTQTKVRAKKYLLDEIILVWIHESRMFQKDSSCRQFPHWGVHKFIKSRPVIE